MPRRSGRRGLYRRGDYWVDWDCRKNGSLRSPFLAIFWYDGERGRVRSLSTGTESLIAAQEALDRYYKQQTKGANYCPTCGRRNEEASNGLVLQAITDYLETKAAAASISAIRPRLAHIVNYIATLPTPAVRCAEIDEIWIEGFREWLGKQPMLSSAGAIIQRDRALSTIENSVIQLAAAIKASNSPVRFKPIQTKALNNTPVRRLTIDELADAFAYATNPLFPEKRGGLHRYLMFSVATAARPDAVHDFSTSAARRQWNPDREVICLNPKGRRQTKKFRAAVSAPRQIVPILTATDGPLIKSVSVQTAWNSMVQRLGWPRDGEGGMKLIRRSIGQLLRDAGTKRAWSEEWRDRARKVPSEEIELQLGHRNLDSNSDLYALFDPDYLEHATAAIEGIIDAIIQRVPRAFELPCA